MQTSLGEAWLKAILRLRAGTCNKRTVNAYILVEQKRRNAYVRSEPKAFVPSPRIGTARHTQAEILCRSTVLCIKGNIHARV